MPRNLKVIPFTALAKKMVHITIFASLMFNLNDVKCQEFIPRPARLLSTLPFQLLNGGTIIVKTQFGNYPDTLNFIFDTGSELDQLGEVSAWVDQYKQHWESRLDSLETYLSKIQNKQNAKRSKKHIR